VTVDEEALELFATLYDEEDTSSREARLSAVHSQQNLDVLRRFAKQPRTLGDLEDEYFSTQHWNETTAREDGTIARDTQFVDEVKDWVIGGPHFFIGTPLYKNPRDPCTSNKAYDEIDLTNIPADYLPRTNYVPACSRAEYRRRTPKVIWTDGEGEKKPVTEYYRHVNRRDVGPSSMRTLIPSIIPKGASHIYTGYSTTFRDMDMMVYFNGLCASLPYGFFVKSTGKGHVLGEILSRLAIPDPVEDISRRIVSRNLLLNSLTIQFADLWEDNWKDSFTDDNWTKDDPRLPADTAFSELTGTWEWDTPLRTRYARRQALVELDVLAAQTLGLTLDELQTIYRVKFHVLRKYEQNTWYDQNGRIIYTKNRGLPGVGFKSKQWKEVKDKPSGTVEQTVEDDTQPGGPVKRTIVYEAPFDKCDREADYERAWAAFEGRESRK
jgi:hypothetical protein